MGAPEEGHLRWFLGCYGKEIEAWVPWFARGLERDQLAQKAS